jgi:hypothetical protein
MRVRGDVIAGAVVMAVAVVAISTSVQAANPIPDKVDAFVAYCAGHLADCRSTIVEADVAVLATKLFAKQGEQLCTIPRGVSMDNATKQILAWLGSHQNVYAKSTNDGIQAAVTALWHCQVQIGDGSVPGGPPAKTGAFVAYCPTHDVKCADEMVAAAVSIMVPDRPVHCLPPRGTKNTDISRAVLSWLGQHKETYGFDTIDGIAVAFDHLWPCRLSVTPPNGNNVPVTGGGVAAAKEPTPQKGSLAFEVLERLKTTREYKKLSSYYDKMKDRDPAWVPSAQGRAVETHLVALRSDAAATRAVDTGNAKYLEYAVGGTTVIDKGILPADLKSDPDYRAFIANSVAANIANDKTLQTFLTTLGKNEGLSR